MPRASKPEPGDIKNNTLIIDNGAYTIKAGYVSASPDVADCQIIPNCIVRDSDKRIWVGSQLQQCKDFRELAFRRPVDRGYLVNWESERAIWGHSFFSQASDLKVRGMPFAMNHIANLEVRSS
jgi:actin-related protein 6